MFVSRRLASVYEQGAEPFWHSEISLPERIEQARETNKQLRASKPPKRVVYNFVLGSKRFFALHEPRSIGNNPDKNSAPGEDNHHGAQFESGTPPLYFESRFESGNLRRAVQAGCPHIYLFIYIVGRLFTHAYLFIYIVGRLFTHAYLYDYTYCVGCPHTPICMIIHIV